MTIKHIYEGDRGYGTEEREPTVQLRVYLPKHLLERFQTHCELNRVTMSQMVRSYIVGLVGDPKSQPEAIVDRIACTVAELNYQSARRHNSHLEMDR